MYPGMKNRIPTPCACAVPDVGSEELDAYTHIGELEISKWSSRAQARLAARTQRREPQRRAATGY